MDQEQPREINTRLGKFLIQEDKCIHFPRGLIGMERFKDFVLLQIKADSPFYILQSLEDANLGLMVADPFVFLQDYQVHLSSFEEEMLGISSPEEAAIMVTVNIPPGRPEHTTLNLTGPIVLNSKKKLGLQTVQAEPEKQKRINISELQISTD